MFDHVGITLRELSISSQFSDAVLRPLGRERCHIAFSTADRRPVDVSYAAGES